MRRPPRDLVVVSIAVAALFSLLALCEAADTVETELAPTEYVVFAVMALVGPSLFYATSSKKTGR